MHPNKGNRGDPMRIKKTVWIFAMLMLTAILVLIVNSRIQLTGEVIFGGNNDVFIKTDNLKKPLDDYQKPDDTNKIVARDLTIPISTYRSGSIYS